MDEPILCETCGSPLPRGSELIGCPRCLLSLVAEPEIRDPNGGVAPGAEKRQFDPGARLKPGASIGRYRVLRLIGEGGMGAVYEAQQEHPRRIVALKLIKPELASLELLRRFEQESQALGRLQHSGIAQIYEAGTADTGYGPQPYFAMELIHGATLRDYADKHRLSTGERLGIIARVCDAVHHAHQRGLIHRDLKPGNILVDETGQPKVLDFGVARLTDCDTQTTLQTGMGQLVGTLAYMSPEQALGDPLELDTRSDVYSLGVILYELLSARLPYTIGMQFHEALEAIRTEDPERLSSIDRNYGGDIETIVGKALEKDKAQRYSSAAELAADIQRHLRDEPIVARPPSTAYQVKKFARRHKALVGGIAAVFVVLAAGVATISWFAVQASRERDRALQAEQKAAIERDRATAAEVAASRQRDLAVRAGQEATNAEHQATVARTQALTDRDRSAWQSLARESVRLSASRVDDELAVLLARQAFLIFARTPDQPRSLIEEALQQAARLNPASRRISGHEGVVSSVAFSADSARLASGSADRTVRVWDLNDSDVPPVVFAGHTAAVNAVALSPDGTRLASGAVDQKVRVWNLRDPGAPPLSPTGYPPGNVSSVAFSPDGMRVAFSDFSGVRIWDLRSPGSPPVSLKGPELPAGSVLPFTSMAFSPDGVHIAAGDLFGGVRVWDLRTSEPPVLFQSHPGRVNAVAFSPDRKHLVSAGAAAEDTYGPQRGRGFEPGSAQGPDWNIRVWDLANPRLPPALLPGQESQANSLAFSPDGKRLASAGDDGGLRLWDVSQPGARPVRLQAHEGGARSVAFSADGALLATAGTDYGVRVWNLRDSGMPFRPPKAHQDRVESLAFAPNNAYLASGSVDNTVRVWNLGNLTVPPVSLDHEDVVRSIAFSPDGERLASANPRSLRVWNVRDLASQPVSIQDRHGIQSIAFSPDGMALASLTISNSLTLAFLNERGAAPTLVRSDPPAVKRWDLGGAASLSHTLLQDARITADVVAFSEKWDLFASGPGGDGSIAVWDLRRPGFPPVRLTGHQGFLTAVAFSRGGSLLASVGRDLAVRVWDLGRPDAPLFVFRGSGTFAAFSLDNTRLAAGGIDAADVRVWDLRGPGNPPVIFKAGNAAVRSVALSRDGTYLALGDTDGNVWLYRLWTAAADYLCTRVSRNLSIDEWRFHVGESIPYERTCPALPAGKGAPTARR